MLINKGFNQGDTVSLKVANGDELIARFDEETADGYRITKPMAVTLTERGLGFIPWLFFANTDTILLKKDHVFAIATSKESATKQYLELTTGIAL